MINKVKEQELLVQLMGVSQALKLHLQHQLKNRIDMNSKNYLFGMIILFSINCKAIDLVSSFNVEVAQYHEIEENILFVGKARKKKISSQDSISMDTVYFWYGRYDQNFNLISEGIFGGSMYNELDHIGYSKLSKRIYLVGKSSSEKSRRNAELKIFELEYQKVSPVYFKYKDYKVSNVNKVLSSGVGMYLDVDFRRVKKDQAVQGILFFNERTYDFEMIKQMNSYECNIFGLSEGQVLEICNGDVVEKQKKLSIEEKNIYVKYDNWSHLESYNLFGDTLLIGVSTRPGKTVWKYKFVPSQNRNNETVKKKLVVQRKRTWNQRGYIYENLSHRRVFYRTILPTVNSNIQNIEYWNNFLVFTVETKGKFKQYIYDLTKKKKKLISRSDDQSICVVCNGVIYGLVNQKETNKVLLNRIHWN